MGTVHPRLPRGTRGARARNPQRSYAEEAAQTTGPTGATMVRNTSRSHKSSSGTLAFAPVVKV